MEFHFKQFSIQQRNSAMKVGTDGVLLGAWVNLTLNPYSILDIGTGTGLIALQLAQRSNAQIIDAIEIEANAFEEAVNNFEQSDWSDRLYCYHASLKEFTHEISEKYDLIVSNPPFYTDAFVSNDIARNTARFTTHLPFTELLKNASKLLTDKGVFTVIIPYKEEESFITLAQKNQLYPQSICRVKGSESTPIKRSLIALSFQKATTTISSLTIEISRHQYTDQYMDLVHEFYLNM